MHVPCLSSIFSIKAASLVLLSVQTTTMVLLLRYSRTVQPTQPPVDAPVIGDEAVKPLQDLVNLKNDDNPAASSSHLYIISTAVCMCELLKFVVSIFFIVLFEKCHIAKAKVLLQQEVFINNMETWKMIVPAGLYLLQNNLLYLALTNLDAATYQVTYQLRILFTALFSWLMLGKRLNFTHWMSLSFLMIGVALVQVDSGAQVSSSHSDHPSAEILPPPGPLLRANKYSAEEENIDDLMNNRQHGTGNRDQVMGVQVVRPDDDAFMHYDDYDDPPSDELREYSDVLQMVDPPHIDTKGNNEKAHRDEIIPPNHKTGDDSKDMLPLDVRNSAQRINSKVIDSVTAYKEVAWLLGLLAVLVSCVLSAFSGVYFERVVKKSKQTSLVIRNTQLAMFSLMFGAISLFSDRSVIISQGFFQGYTWATWLVIIIQAFGGMLVAVTVKYADNILKVFATSVSIIMSTLISTTLLGSTIPSFTFMIGTFIVLIASLMYSLAPTTDSTPNRKSDSYSSIIKSSSSQFSANSSSTNKVSQSTHAIRMV